MNVSGRQRLLALAGALADEGRLRILASLRGGELCVCRVIALLGLAPSTVSKHLHVLRQAGLVDGRKEGRWMYYRLPDQPDAAARSALNFAFQTMSDDDAVADDARRLKAILRMDAETLCQGQRQGVACCLPIAASRPRPRSQVAFRRHARSRAVNRTRRYHRERA